MQNADCLVPFAQLALKGTLRALISNNLPEKQVRIHAVGRIAQNLIEKRLGQPIHVGGVFHEIRYVEHSMHHDDPEHAKQSQSVDRADGILRDFAAQNEEYVPADRETFQNFVDDSRSCLFEIEGVVAGGHQTCF